MQGSSGEGSKRSLLSRYLGQAVMALIAAVAVNDVPLELVLTDGNQYVILRFRDNLLLSYEDLTATEVGANTSLTAFHRTASVFVP